MTVSKLTDAQKQLIRVNYTSKRMNISEMAKALDVSTRTIGRVLEELDLPSPAPRLKGEAYNMMQVMKKHKLEPSSLETVIELAFKAPDETVMMSRTMDFMTALPEDKYNKLLAAVIHMREAKKQNVHVQTAMLNLQEKAAKNERDTKEGNV